MTLEEFQKKLQENIIKKNSSSSSTSVLNKSNSSSNATTSNSSSVLNKATTASTILNNLKNQISNNSNTSTSSTVKKNNTVEKALEKFENDAKEKSSDSDKNTVLKKVQTAVEEYQKQNSTKNAVESTKKTTEENEKANPLITKNTDTKETLKAPVSESLKKVTDDIETTEKEETVLDKIENVLEGALSGKLKDEEINKEDDNYTILEAGNDVIWGGAHASKGIGKAMLSSVNNATPYISKLTEDYKNIRDSIKYSGGENTAQYIGEGVKDVLLSGLDNILDNTGIGEKIGVNLVDQEQYDSQKISNDEIQNTVDTNYNSHITNETVAGVSQAVSEMAVVTGLQMLGVPATVSNSAFSFLDTYGDTNDTAEIVGNTAVGAIFGGTADVTSGILNEAFKSIIPKAGEKIIPTLIANYGSYFTTGYMSKWFAETVTQLGKNYVNDGTFGLTEEQENQINKNALVTAIIYGGISGTTSSIADIKTIKSNNASSVTGDKNLDESVEKAVGKIEDLNRQAEHMYTETKGSMSTEKIAKRTEKAINETLTELEKQLTEAGATQKTINKALETVRNSYNNGNITYDDILTVVQGVIDARKIADITGTVSNDLGTTASSVATNATSGTTALLPVASSTSNSLAPTANNIGTAVTQNSSVANVISNAVSENTNAIAPTQTTNNTDIAPTVTNTTSTNAVPTVSTSTEATTDSSKLQTLKTELIEAVQNDTNIQADTKTAITSVIEKTNSTDTLKNIANELSEITNSTNTTTTTNNIKATVTSDATTLEEAKEKLTEYVKNEKNISETNREARLQEIKSIGTNEEDPLGNLDLENTTPLERVQNLEKEIRQEVSNTDASQITFDNMSSELKDLVYDDNSLTNTQKNEIIEKINKATTTSELKDIAEEISNIANTANEIASIRKSQEGVHVVQLSEAQQYKNNKIKIDDKVLNNALDTVQANRQGRRTKQEWLQVAQQIGSNIQGDIDTAKTYAYKTWYQLHPNQATNLNRQGQKYVKFTQDEYVEAVLDSYQKANNNSEQLNVPIKENVEKSSKIEYNENGLRLAVREYKAVTSAINTDSPNLANRTAYKFYGDYMYIFNKNDFDDYTFTAKIDIESNHDLIRDITKEDKNGVVKSSEDFIRDIERYATEGQRYSRGRYNRSDVDSTNDTSDRGSVRLHQREGTETRTNDRQLNKESNRNQSNNGLENSEKGSFLVDEIKEKQLEIIKNTNPMTDDYHTGIRTAEDIKTFEEIVDENGLIDYAPDLTKDMIEEALNTREITVYSSYPIEQGVFVTPSKMEAKSYAGSGKVYAKVVNINDVAWIDLIEGQYANVNDSLSTSVSTIGTDDIVNDFNGYTDKEIKDISSNNIEIARDNNSIISFVNKVKNIYSNKKLYVSKVKDETAQKVKENLGLDIKNYNISLNSSGVSHSFKKHGNYEKEKLRGQIAIDETDFINVKDIVNEANNISYEGKDSEGHDLLKFEKNIDGNNVLIAYISKKHMNLELKTLYKQKKNSVTAFNMEENATLNSTSETTSDTSSINNIIPSKNNYVNNLENGKNTSKIDNANLEENVMQNTENTLELANEANESILNENGQEYQIAPTVENQEIVKKARKYKKPTYENSSDKAQKLLDEYKILLNGTVPTKETFDNGVQIAKSGNIYFNHRKPTNEDYLQGLDGYFKTGEKRLKLNEEANGYIAQVYDGRRFIDETDNIYTLYDTSAENVDNINYDDVERIVKDTLGEDAIEIFDESGSTKTSQYLGKRKIEQTSNKELLDEVYQKFVDKYHYTEKLGEKTNNKEISYKTDRYLASGSEAQYNIGVKQTDLKGNTIGPSTKEIFDKFRKMKIYDDVDDYLKICTAIERQTQSVSPYGEKITSEQLRKTKEYYEKKYPDIEEEVKPVWNYLKNVLKMETEAGLTTKELSETLESIYKQYVPISKTGVIINDEEQELISKGIKEGKVIPNQPIKRAKGGAGKMVTTEEAINRRVIASRKAIRYNNLLKEIARSTGNEKLLEETGEFAFASNTQYDQGGVNIGNVGVVHIDGETDYTANIYVNGELKEFKIDRDLFESLRQDSLNVKFNQSKIGRSAPVTIIKGVTRVRKSLVTTFNLAFAVRNPIKDLQDGLIKTKFDDVTFANNYERAVKEIVTKGEYYQKFMAMGGMYTSYTNPDGSIKLDATWRNPVKKILQKIADINEAVELPARISELISSIEAGMSDDESFQNACNATVNYGRYGEVTTIIDQCGGMFINPSIQATVGTTKTVTGCKTVQAWGRLIFNFALAGLAPSLLNWWLLKDDDEYNSLEDYIKDEYYLLKVDWLPEKVQNVLYSIGFGDFLRIPKGRIQASISAIFNSLYSGITDGDWKLKYTASETWSQIGINNPFSSNILSPVIDVMNNETWYGTDLVPTRLQNELPKNQYDETTSSVAIWLGQKLNISPYKINYLMDQYSGGIGDVLLPLTTEKAENNMISNIFSVSSVDKNKYVSDFYDTLDELEKIKNDSNATDDDVTKYTYMSKISSKMSELYKQKREIQADTTLTDKEKISQTQEIQSQINEYAESAINLVNSDTTDTETLWNMYTDGIISDTVRESDGYSPLQDALYAVENGLATKEEYIELYQEAKENNTSLPTMTTLQTLKENNVSLSTYQDYAVNTKTLESDKDENGNTISNSLTSKKADYIMSMDISDNEKNTLLNMLSSGTTVSDLEKLDGDYLTYFQQSTKTTSNGLSAREKYMSLINAGISAEQLNTFYSQISSITGSDTTSKKQAVFNFINSLSLSIPQKMILLAKQYSSFAKLYLKEIVTYIVGLKNTTRKEKLQTLITILS